MTDWIMREDGNVSMILGFLARGEWWCWKRLGRERGIEKVSERK